jgi:hypothetical protein
MATQHDATETYLLIITRRDTTEILLSQKGTNWTLPRVEIRKQQRIAEQLTAETEEVWGLKSWCLFVPSPCGRKGEPTSAVMECVNHNERAPAGTYWMPLNVAAECGEAEEAAAIRVALAEMASYTSGEKPGPFAKPGWMRELFSWAYEQIVPLGLRLTGNFRQYNATPTFSLLRIETDVDALWFKATGEPHAHELPITVLLARLFPDHVPRLLGIHPSWNGWLAAEASGTTLDETADCSTWERVAAALAELQIASIGKNTELLEAQCKDFRLAEIGRLIDPFFARMRDFMAAQKKTSPPPLVNSEIASLREGLNESRSLLQSFRLPDTLGHIDLNPGNILVSPSRCVFLDWAEGCVTNPLITFEYLRRHMERRGIREQAAYSRITTAYIRPWAAFFSPEDLRRALAAVPPVAVFVHAICGDTWRTLDPVSNPALAGYFRSLTRRMYRDAVLAAERSERCLS